jgi:hypothetical protein
MAVTEKGPLSISITQPPRQDSHSSAISLKSPRTARFAEATSVNSPIEPRKQDLPYLPAPGPASPALKSPLKSALKSPGLPRNQTNPLSPSFAPGIESKNYEADLEKQEESTEKEQAKDLVRFETPFPPSPGLERTPVSLAFPSHTR